MFKLFKKFKISPYAAVLISFLSVILFGAFLLAFPAAYQDNNWPSFVNALFLSTSCVCVTGLNVFPNVVNTMTVYGKIVMAVLIQIGGLGFITIFTFIFTLFNKRLAASDRYLVKEALSFKTFEGVISLVRSMILISFVIEICGVIPFLFVFVPIYGPLPGLGKAVFHSISSFNNAGFDLIGADSLEPFRNNYIIMLNTAILVILGGLGFLTIRDILKANRAKFWSIHSKVVILMTSILILFGMFFYYVLNLKNAEPLSIIQAFFLSVSSRTAGFSVYHIPNMNPFARIIVLLLMITGVGPLSTGGGLKVTTVFVILATIISFIRGRKSNAFNRSFTIKTFIQAVTLLIIVFLTLILSYSIISAIEVNNRFILAKGWTTEPILFEVVSAFSTTGLSWGITPSLSVGSKLILIFLMFFGRVGPMTIMSVVSNSMHRHQKENFKYIETDLIVG